MDEHDLQRELTTKWAKCGLWIDGRRHALLAWEVMFPSWRINDASMHWSEPSLDFLMADEQMRLTVIELKRKVPGIKPAWQALCQVTHRAIELSRTFSPENLEQAFRACWSGDHGRVQRPAECFSLSEYHRRCFGLDTCVPVVAQPVCRCVVAPEFGEQWSHVLDEFNRLSGQSLQQRVREELTSKNARRDLDRFTSLQLQSFAGLSGPVLTLPLPSNA